MNPDHRETPTKSPTRLHLSHALPDLAPTASDTPRAPALTRRAHRPHALVALGDLVALAAVLLLWLLLVLYAAHSAARLH